MDAVGPAPGAPARPSPAGKGRGWRLAWALHRLALRTGEGPLRPLWLRGHLLLARAAAAYVRRGGRDTAAYLQGSFAHGDPVLGVSDLDLVLVYPQGARTPERRARAAARWASLCAALPWLEKLVYLTVYGEAELAGAASASALTYGLERGPEEGRALLCGEAAAGAKLSLRLRPGLCPPTADWRRLSGPERRPRPAARPPSHLAAWLELQHWWQHAFVACAGPAARKPHVAYLCVKLVAEPARILLAVGPGELVDGRREALERAALAFPEEGDAFRFALELHRSLPRDPEPPLVEALRVLVRLSSRIARLLTAELAGHGSTSVALAGAGDEPVRPAGADAARALAPPGAQPRILPLADWRALALPGLPDEALVVLEGDPGDPAVVGAAARAERPGLAPALAADSVLVLPAAGGSARPLPRGALRAIHFAGSDPVSFALSTGARAAAFPAAAGWSAQDWARRAVAEHRAWLATGPGGDGAPEAELGGLLTAARAALLLESLEAGSPSLAVSASAVAAALARRPGTEAAAAEAFAAYRRCRVDGDPPARPIVAAFRRAVSDLPPYVRAR